jgi:hypothetical protein
MPAGWSSPGFDDAAWTAASVDTTVPTTRLVTQTDPPVRIVQERKPQSVTEVTPGTWIFDLGQNMVGKVRLHAQGPAGTRIRIRHAEVLNPNGTAYTANLRSAQATDHFLLAGTGADEVYEPHLTYHGFRYVELTGYPGTPDLDTVTGLVMHTDAPFTSTFETSNPMINKLHSNITWGQRGNFLSIPTDTPARDERLGWAGDINVFTPTATFNMDVRSFLGKWLQDLRDGAGTSGAYPDVAPRLGLGEGNAGWADAGVTIPYTLWQRYGDTRVIERNYDAMVKFVEWMRSGAVLNEREQGAYGDWLNLSDPTPSKVIGTAYYAQSTRMLSEMAAAIGRDADAATYRTLAADITQKFNDTNVDAAGKVAGDSQTAYVLALEMDMLPEAKRVAAGQNLVEAVKRRDWHLSTGFLGTPGLLPALAETGNIDVAYRLLLNKTFPSWGYEIAKGATTVWERWDSIKADGSFGDVSMNSFNHYAYGAVGDWMYRTIGGIRPDPAHPGYEHFTVHPQPGGGLTHARATYDSVAGRISSAWELDEQGRMTLDVTVPANTTATLRFPAGDRSVVTESGGLAEQADGVRFVRSGAGEVVYELGSGTYSFAVDRALVNLRSAEGDIAELRTALAGLTAAQRDELEGRLGSVAGQVTAARTAREAGDAHLAADRVHDALAEVAAIEQWLSTQASGAADALRADLDALFAHLSQASSALLRAPASTELAPAEAMAGEVVRVTTLLRNDGERQLGDVRASLKAPSGWTVTEVAPGPQTLAPGQQSKTTYDVRIPATAAAGPLPLTGSVAYRHGTGSVRIPVLALLDVRPAVVPIALETSPDSVEPGGTVRLTATVRNRASVPASGSLALELPAGWSASPATVAYDLAPGAEQQAVVDVTAGLEATDGPASVAVLAGDRDDERRSTSVNVEIAVPPNGYEDYVDLGDTTSETSHNLTASTGGGTSTEAGRSRRYTNVSNNNGYFEFDLRVVAGKPFVLRAIETYDGSQTKTYDVLVDGVRVHARAYNRTAAGAATVTFQFPVDASAATSDGLVKVRFQDVPGGFDPSIADVWSITGAGREATR